MRRRRPPDDRHPASRLGLTFAVVFALLAAQWLGLAHTVLHGTAPAPSAVQASGHPPSPHPAHDAAPAHEHRHGLAALFAGHDDGSADCRLYDQLAHAEPLPPALPALDTLPPAPPRLAAGRTHDAAAEAAPYAARGPPRA
ncbi:hypothetical protein LOC51_16835 [Rubrivivax sp. JA1024]|nr:hypothetical protein [Rubrivivax sp. JA1024]